MDHDTIAAMRRTSGAWRLLCSDNVALVLSFLNRVFIDENVREIAESELVNRLDDDLYALNLHRGADAYPKSAKAYLADWAHPDRGWLRRYYPHGSDEPHYDATPDVELAMAWVRDLAPRDFVGTESRLNTVFDLLRQMVYGAETDTAARRDELLRRRADIDAELDRLDRGIVDTLGPAAQQDRYQQVARTARELLADFRQVEENFRQLDRNLRGRIAAWDGTKAELLDEALGSRNSIAGSPQGQSFAAFFDFLLAPQRQAELVELLGRLADIDGVDVDDRLRFVHHDWHTAGERTQATVRALSEQLRKFLDDQAWLENRRIIELIKAIQSSAIEVKEADTSEFTTELDEASPTFALPTERPLFEPQARLELDSDVIAADEVDIDDSVLYDQTYVNNAELAQNVRESLQAASTVRLTDILDERPLTQGLAELVAYMSVRDDTFVTDFDDDARDTVRLGDDADARVVRLPRITFRARADVRR